MLPEKREMCGPHGRFVGLSRDGENENRSKVQKLAARCRVAESVARLQRMMAESVERLQRMPKANLVGYTLSLEYQKEVADCKLE